MWNLFYRDLWGPIWLNLAASAIVWLPVFVWHHRRIKAHITKTMKGAQCSDRSA